MSEQTFQHRVQPWMMECFGPAIAADTHERNHRFLEEALELVQACGATQSEAHQLVDYVYGRPVGERAQEVGGVMVTLAALCLAQDLDMHQAGDVELARIWMKVEQIRAKQAAKPKHSPLPAAAPVAAQEPDGWVTKDLLFPSLHRKPHRALYLREVPEDVTGIEDLRGRTWEGKTAYEIKPFYFASQPAPGELAKTGDLHNFAKSQPAQDEQTNLPTDYTDEQLAAGLESVAIWRKQNGVLSDESLCGMVYDAMRAAAPTPPETWKVLPSQLPAAEIHVCPACLGRPSKPVVAFMNTGEDWTQHYQKEVDFICQVCSATGRVSDDVNRRYYAGRLHRHVRVQRGETMRDAAARLGITVPQLSAWELGYAGLPIGESLQEAKE